MKRRLYFLLDNTQSAVQLVDKLLLKKVGLRHIQAIGCSHVDMSDLPRAKLTDRSDLIPAITIGVLIGALIGLIGGFIGHATLDFNIEGGIIATTLVGALIGALGSGIVGAGSLNARLKKFQNQLNKGKIVLMVDVKKEQVSEFEQYVKQHFPEADYKGIEPTIPAFP